MDITLQFSKIDNEMLVLTRSWLKNKPAIIAVANRSIFDKVSTSEDNEIERALDKIQLSGGKVHCELNFVEIEEK